MKNLRIKNFFMYQKEKFMIHIDYNDLVPWHFLFGEGNSLKNLKESKKEELKQLKYEYKNSRKGV